MLSVHIANIVGPPDLSKRAQICKQVRPPLFPFSPFPLSPYFLSSPPPSEEAVKCDPDLYDLYVRTFILVVTYGKTPITGLAEGLRPGTHY